MDRPNISKATQADISNLLHLVNNAFRGDEAKQGWTHEADLIEGSLRIDETSLRLLMAKPNAVILKYTDEQKLAGCVYLEKKGSDLYLGMLTVAPKIQAKGIGKTLMSAAEAYAKENNCTAIEMTVISVRHELISWYERLGYHKTEETKPFHDDGRFGKPRQQLHFVVMKKEV
jgi:ribosomal protein S18 acetylase RimI-like enzyme